LPSTTTVMALREGTVGAASRQAPVVKRKTAISFAVCDDDKENMVCANNMVHTASQGIVRKGTPYRKKSRFGHVAEARVAQVATPTDVRLCIPDVSDASALAHT